MNRWILDLIAFIQIWRSIDAQYTSQTYPDPRFDPFTCKISTTGPLCDPSELITFGEKKRLAVRINELLAYSSTIPNTSPACLSLANKNLEIIIAVIDKIGSVPLAPVDIQKFANNLKSRYQSFQDVSLCDTMVLIVSSKRDRQVFTVAGKDTKLTKEMLKNAFDQNVEYFKTGDFAHGIQGMVEYISQSYNNAHSHPSFRPNVSKVLPEVPGATIDNVRDRSVINGVSQTLNNLIGQTTTSPSILLGKNENPDTENEVGSSSLNIDQYHFDNESEQLWVNIISQAVARCGNNQAKLSRFVQTVAEEAMSISLGLISDDWYDEIEQEAKATPGDPVARNEAWENARVKFIEPLYQKYATLIRSRGNLRCPARYGNSRRLS